MCNNTAFQCVNLTQEQCTEVALVIGIVNLVISVISLSPLLCLLLILKRKAWNSPVKRLSLIITTSIGLSELVYASVKFYNDFLPVLWCQAFDMFSSYFVFSIILYLTGLVSILLFQIGAPIIPEHWKQKLMSRLLFLEVMIHILLPVLSVTFAALEGFVFDNSASLCKKRECGPENKYFSAMSYALLAFVVVVLFVTIIILVYFWVKFCKTRGITRQTKWLLLKLSVLLVLLVTEIGLQISFYWGHKMYVELTFGELAIILELVILLAILALVYLPSHKWCKCFKRAPNQIPLLLNSGTQQTNPVSVWDHANDPSVTVYNPPPEMSDCVTDTAQYEPQYMSDAPTHALMYATKYGSINNQ